MTLQEAEELHTWLRSEIDRIEFETKELAKPFFENHPEYGWFVFIHKYDSKLNFYINYLNGGTVTVAPISFGGSAVSPYVSRRSSRQQPISPNVAPEPRLMWDALKKTRCGIRYFRVLPMYYTFKNKWKNQFFSDEEKEILNQIEALLEKLQDNENWNINTLNLIEKYDRSKQNRG